MKRKIELNGKTILVTGCPGFIGANLVIRLLKEMSSGTVVSLDNMNDYYDVSLKEWRLAQVEKAAEGSPVRHVFVKGSIGDKALVDQLFEEYHFDVVVNLAAQAGVRYSIDHPDVYIESNIIGFYNLLEACRHHPVEHLVYASSSSVYGGNKKVPFSTEDKVDNPVSLYAATKKSNELMAHTYSHLFNLPTTGLRFFTVYGPWGRPDMALFIFTKAILEGKPIEVFNGGDMQRDFTYIDDIVEGVVRVLDDPPKGDPEWSGKNPNPATAPSPYRLYNIGNSSPVKLMDFVRTIEEELGTNAQIEYRPLQAGDVPATWADVEDLWEKQNFRPQTPIKEGIGKFIAWYKKFYAIEN